jgi:putative transposase
MPRTRYTNAQIAHALRALQDGVTVLEICRKFGAAEQTVYRWKRKYGAMMPREIKQLEDENQRLKSIVADLTLDKQMLQEVLRTTPESFARPRRGQGAAVRPWRERATRSAGALLAAEFASLRELREGPDGAPDEASRPGIGSSTLRLPSIDRPAAPRRLGREPHARLPHLP